MTHRDWELLVSLYADGEATAEEAGRARTHLATCPGCRKLYEAHDRLRQAYQATPAPTSHRVPDWRSARTPPGVAFGLVGAMVALILVVAALARLVPQEPAPEAAPAAATGLVSDARPTSTVTALPTSAPSSPSTATEPSGVEIPFRVCESAREWQRPSVEELIARFESSESPQLAEAIRRAQEEPILVDDGSVSAFGSVLALHGLPEDVMSQGRCPDDWPRAQTGEDIVLWLIESRLRSVEVRADDVIFHLEGAERGYQQVAVGAMHMSDAVAGGARVQFVGDDGAEVASGRVRCQRAPLTFGPREGETVISCFIENLRIEAPGWPSPSAGQVPPLGWLAFVRDCALWVKGVPDGYERKVDEGCAIERPAWSPSGRWLSYRKGDATWLWYAETNDLQWLTSDGGWPVWAPAEDRIAYTDGQGTVHVTTVPDTHRALTSRQWVSQFGAANRLAWSPDGKWLAVEVMRREQGSEPPSVTAQGLYRMRSESDGPRADFAPVYLNPDPVATQSWLESWSADGQHILFWEGRFLSASIGADGMPLMAVAASGGQPFQVWESALPRSGFLDWSPDGERLALVVGGGRETWDNQAIAVGTLAGGLQVVSDEGRSDLYPAWSPDGSRIAYTTQPAVPNVPGGSDEQTRMAERRIWVMAPDGSEKHARTYDPDYRDEHPEWSRDGQHILFARIQGDGAELWLMWDDGSAARPVVTGLQLPHLGGSFGFYGYLDWGRLYDWWPGTCREGPRC